MSYPARALFYYLRKAYPDCVCEKPFLKYKMDIFLPDIGLALEHDGHYRHSGEEERKRAEQKDHALRKAGYQVLRICDSKDLAESVVSQDNKILYRYDERNQYLNQMIAAAFCYLGAPPLDFNHLRDQYEINQMYFHERKKRTLAVEYPRLAEEWSSKNPNKPDSVLSGSPRKVWWHCPKCQQEYQAAVASRTKNHSSCPFCANLRAYEKNCPWSRMMWQTSQAKNTGGNAKKGTNGKALPGISTGFHPQNSVLFVMIAPSARTILCSPEVQN